MSFFAASEPAIHYDTNGVSIEAVSVAACKDEDKPKLFGAAPVEASCTVVRSGSRDIAPPPVARTSSDLDALQRALAATYPGAVAPCPARDGGAAAAQIFLDRCLAHAEFGDSPLLVDFLLQRGRRAEHFDEAPRRRWKKHRPSQTPRRRSPTPRTRSEKKKSWALAGATSRRP